jgi:hypothetical protein
MSCCGEKRSKIYHNPYSPSGMDEGTFAGQTAQLPEGSYFVYTGATSMTAKGVITGTVYRFETTGSKLEVDRRDASFLTGVPNLKKVQGDK